MAFDRLELALQLGIGVCVSVDGAAGECAEVWILEQLPGHRLEQLPVGQRVRGGNHVRGGDDLGVAGKHPAEVCDEAGAGLDECVRTHGLDQLPARLLQPAAIFREEVFKLAAVGAGAREEVVAGPGIHLHRRHLRSRKPRTNESAGTDWCAAWGSSGRHLSKSFLRDVR